MTFRIKPMRYPVRGRGAWSIETVAWFFDYYAAVRFVNESPRTLYIGEPDYDDRDRFLEPLRNGELDLTTDDVAGPLAKRRAA